MNNPNYSQIAQGSRVNPINQRPRGLTSNWADSIISAMLYYQSDTWIEPFEFAQASYVQILLFCQDFPVIARPYSFYGPIGTPDLAYPSHPEPGLAFDGTHLDWMGNLLYTTPQPSPIGYKSAVFGNTFTDGVPTSGYLGWFQVTARNYYTVAKYETCMLALDFFCNATIMAGKSEQMESATTVARRPIILEETAYTQEMFDAGNTVHQVFGPLDETLDIVGIWADIAVPLNPPPMPPHWDPK